MCNCAIDCTNGHLPIAQRVLENYILLPKGYSQKPQHNFPRFLELFSNFYYLTATHTADRLIVLAQKHPNFTFKVCSNGPLMLYFDLSYKTWLLGTQVIRQISISNVWKFGHIFYCWFCGRVWTWQSQLGYKIDNKKMWTNFYTLCIENWLKTKIFICRYLF